MCWVGTLPVSAKDGCPWDRRQVRTIARDVFISYAVEDKPTADAVCATLEAERIRCWMAPRDVLPGASYAAAIIDASAQSSLMVLVFSSRSNNTQEVLRQVETAANKGIRILVFGIENAVPSGFMTPFLRESHWPGASSPLRERHLVRLKSVVLELLQPTDVAKLLATGDAGAVMACAISVDGTGSSHPSWPHRPGQLLRHQLKGGVHSIGNRPRRRQRKPWT